MKYKTVLGTALLLCLLLLPGFSFCENADVSPEPLPISIRREEAWGAVNEATGEADSFVIYPILTTDDAALAPILEKVNQAIQEKAHISAYLQLLSTLQAGGTGLKMAYDMGLSCTLGEDGGIHDWVLSLLFSAEGRMLSGRPSQVFYPMTFDLRTGEEITFEQLFTDPDGAKAWIETYLEEVVEPTLSTYLENSQLFPVPFDRFFLDSFGRVILVYENSQLSFLSGMSGAVAFRYSELSDYLDYSQEGVVAHLPWIGYSAFMTQDQRADSTWSYLRCCALIPRNYSALVGQSMETVLHGYSQTAFPLHAAADSEYYPGGACYEMEEPEFRGALVLTDEGEEKVTGLLTGSLSLYDLETGKTTLTQAESFLGREPDARLTIDGDTASLYRVCPGTAAMYRLESYSGLPLVFTLYADENGIVQYLKLSLA